MSFDYQVIKRPRRRTVSISVKPDCSVQLLVPAYLSDRKISDLVKQKSSWIKSKISYFKEIQKYHKEKEYVSGECFSYLGRNYRLKIDENHTNDKVRLVNGKFNTPVKAGLENGERTRLIIKLLTAWYEQQAFTRLEEKVRLYAGQTGVSPASVGIKGYNTRWGSCHSDGRIFFNWRIIMAPPSVVDYVVVHELCHLVHHNHSRNFWGLVATILPDYTKRKDWLRLNGGQLKI